MRLVSHRLAKHIPHVECIGVSVAAISQTTTGTMVTHTATGSAHQESPGRTGSILAGGQRRSPLYYGTLDQRAMAAAIRDLSLPSDEAEARRLVTLAHRVAGCGARVVLASRTDGTSREQTLHCGYRKLCPRCANRIAWLNGLRDAARAVVAYRDNPHLLFFYVTLTDGASLDLVEHEGRIKRRLFALRRRKSTAWGASCGEIWFMEVDRDREGLLRPHLHVVVALDRRDRIDPHRLLTEWSAEANVGGGELTRFRGLSSQHVTPLFCQSPTEAEPRELTDAALASDVFRICRYSAKSLRLNRRDRILVHFLSGRCRGTSGVFRGHALAAVRPIVDWIRTLDLSTRRKSDTKAPGPRLKDSYWYQRWSRTRAGRAVQASSRHSPDVSDVESRAKYPLRVSQSCGSSSPDPLYRDLQRHARADAEAKATVWTGLKCHSFAMSGDERRWCWVRVSSTESLMRARHSAFHARSLS